MEKKYDFGVKNGGIPPAVSEFAVEERQRLLDRIEAQAREIERLSDRNCAAEDELARNLDYKVLYVALRKELAALKAQPSGVDVNKAARALCDRHADICGVDREDQWKTYSQDFIDDAAAVLEAINSPSVSAAYPFPERFEMEPFQTVNKGSTNYKAGFNQALKLCKEAIGQGSAVSTGVVDAQAELEQLRAQLHSLQGAGEPVFPVRVTGSLDEIDAQVWPFINAEAQKVGAELGRIEAYSYERANGGVVVLWDANKVHAMAVTIRDDLNRTRCVRMLADPDAVAVRRELLEQLQWQWVARDEFNSVESGVYCPICFNKRAKGPLEDCEFRALLAGEEGVK